MEIPNSYPIHIRSLRDTVSKRYRQQEIPSVTLWIIHVFMYTYVCMWQCTVRACGPMIIATLTLLFFDIFLATSVWYPQHETRDGFDSMMTWRQGSHFPGIGRRHTFRPSSRFRKVKLPLSEGKCFPKHYYYVAVRKRSHQTGSDVRPSVHIISFLLF